MGCRTQSSKDGVHGWKCAGCCTPRDLKELAQLAIFNCSVEGSLMQARHILSAVDAVQGQVDTSVSFSIKALQTKSMTKAA